MDVVFAFYGFGEASAGPEGLEIVHAAPGKELDYYLEYAAREALRQLDKVPAKMILPQNPAALSFVLNRLTNAELAQAPAHKAVWQAQVDRKGINPDVRERALGLLAKALVLSKPAELAGTRAALLDSLGVVPDPGLRANFHPLLTKSRTGQDYVETLQVGQELTALLPPESSNGLRRQLRALGVPVFVIKTVHEQMRYDTPRIVVEPGKPLEFIFENLDAMPDNIVSVTPGPLPFVPTRGAFLSGSLLYFLHRPSGASWGRRLLPNFRRRPRALSRPPSAVDCLPAPPGWIRAPSSSPPPPASPDPALFLQSRHSRGHSGWKD